MELPNTGFPDGYFIIRNTANGRVLDVASDGVEDGTEVILWPQQETSLVESKICIPCAYVCQANAGISTQKP